MMKYSLLKICFLVISALVLHSCAYKKATPPPAQKPLVQAQTPQVAPQPTPPVTATPAQPSADTSDITTKPGFLGKSTNPEKEAKAVVESMARQGDTESRRRNLTFYIQNVSGITLYATCFSYVKLHRSQNWRWRKSEVIEIPPKSKAPCTIQFRDDFIDSRHTFAALAVFPDHAQADDVTYEILRDENKLDLDQVIEIENKTVQVGIERYGFREAFYDYNFVDDKEKPINLHAELDFFVQNKMGKPIFVTGFIYAKKAKGRWISAEDAKDDMSVWRFYKTKVLRLESDQTGLIDVDSIVPQRDRSYVRGYLGVFDEENEQDAHLKTYELLSDQERISIGTLSKRQGRTIVLEVEKYGVSNDIIEFTVKPIRWIDFTKIVR